MVNTMSESGNEDPVIGCDDVDYRRTGIVQPHAALLVLSEPDLRVIQASQSVADVLGVAAADLLGTAPLEDGLLVCSEDLRPRLADDPLLDPVVLPPMHAVDHRPLIGRLHRRDGRLLLELQPDTTPDDVTLPPGEHLLGDLLEAASAARSLEELLDELVQQLRLHLGFDRVVVNQLDADCNGAVVAEARAATLEPHLGIHFPASDVPRSAREMLAAVPVRTTVDQDAEPSPLHPARDPDLERGVDLTQVRCRAVGGYCQQYYRNMQVRATLVIPIVIGDRLWGWIAARDRQPRRIPPHHDRLLASVAQLVSFAVCRFEQQARAEAERSIAKMQRSLSRLCPSDPAWLDELTGHIQSLRETLPGDGLAVLIGEDTLTAGHLMLPRETLGALASALDARPDGRAVNARCLRSACPDLELGDTPVAGALVVRLPSGDQDAVIWLRRSRESATTWAGKPEETARWKAEGSPDLRPRSSFAAWREINRDSCAEWTPEQRSLAETAALQLGLQLKSHHATQASRAKTEFLTNMSHEFRTPLTAILGFSDLLAADSDDPAVLETTESIHRQGTHLLSLLTDILDLARIEAGPLELLREPCRVPTVIADVAAFFADRARAKGIELRTSWDEPIPIDVTTDPARLRQALINLVDNAIKFSSAGTVEITASWRPSSPALPAHGRVAIAVRDEGPGMDPQQIERAFRPFEQADGSASRNAGGTGLGLSIAQRLADRLGGAIEVASHRGQGSVFTLTFDPGPVDPATFRVPGTEPTPPPAGTPAAPPAPREDARPQPHRPPSSDGGVLAGRSILYVEDGPDNQRLVTFMLRRVGATVDLAENGRLGLEQFEAAEADGRPYDLVIMDMQMPEMDGYTATSILRTRGCETPVVAFTAHAMPGDRERCLDAGCDDYLPKPARPKPLVDMILQWLDRRSAKAGRPLDAATDDDRSSPSSP